jgi:serine/threonine protein kinase
MFNNILAMNFKWPKTFPEKAKDFVKKLLQSTPSSRPPLDQLLQHPWFKDIEPLRPLPALLLNQKSDKNITINVGQDENIDGSTSTCDWQKSLKDRKGSEKRLTKQKEILKLTESSL